MLTCEKMDNNNLSPSIGITNGTGMNNNNSSENIYIDIPTPSTRSVSPLSSASPGKDKSFGFFHNIYRKISLKSNDENSAHEEDSRSSSVDSCSSLSDRLQAPPKQRRSSPCVELADQTSTLDTSGTSSDSVNNLDKQGRTTRRSSVRKLLESLSIGTPPRARSLSCSSTSVNFLSSQKSLKQKAESKASLFSSNSASATTTTNTNASSKPPPKKILRRPVSYTYIRGISGLPTQRVPRSSICCSYYAR